MKPLTTKFNYLLTTLATYQYILILIAAMSGQWVVSKVRPAALWPTAHIVVASSCHGYYMLVDDLIIIMLK